MAYGETYEEFVEKFKPKKTTDDCYTPPEIYEIVKSWAVKEYGLEGRPIVRPFWPGGDFESFEYPNDCVVLNNPPFSKMKKIIEFYQERNIGFFLFASGITLFCRYVKPGTGYVIIGENIVYENGASVPTGFITNLDKSGTKIRLSAELASKIRKHQQQDTRTISKYAYPDNVVSGAMIKKYCVDEIRIGEDECSYLWSLDSQRGTGKSIYGGGMLISDDAVKRLKNAKAEHLRRENKKPDGEPDNVWELSEREREIIASMGQGCRK